MSETGPGWDRIAADIVALAGLDAMPCKLGWTEGCPYRSCERAGQCQAP
jgi:hypothetical protein